MTSGTIDTTELRLLSNILALVLDEHPGQAAAALDTLRRRAANSRVTAGALKNLFDRVSAELPDAAMAPPRAGRTETQRLQQALEVATVQASRFAAENAALQQSLAHAERRLALYHSGEMAQRRELAGMPRPAQKLPAEQRGLGAGMLGGAVFALMAVLLTHDQPAGFARRLHPPALPAWQRATADPAAAPGAPPPPWARAGALP